MKKLLLLVFISLFCFKSSAQDPDLFRTWYLYHVAIDFDEPYDISNINPLIHPFLTIEEDFSFSGDGACNTFNGVFVIDSFEMNASSFNTTNDDCNIQIHNSFENDYFGFISEAFEYTITTESDGLTLYVSTPLMSGLWFKEFPLSTNNNHRNKLILYPNPVSKELFISSEKNIQKVTIYTISGQKVLEINSQSNSIDVSSLLKGMYFIEIYSNQEKTTKRFIKL